MEFKKQVHREAEEYRNKKTKEILSKSNPSEMEKHIIEQWGRMFN